jgi:hypothetical protein
MGKGPEIEGWPSPYAKAAARRKPRPERGAARKTRISQGQASDDQYDTNSDQGGRYLRKTNRTHIVGTDCRKFGGKDEAKGVLTQSHFCQPQRCQSRALHVSVSVAPSPAAADVKIIGRLKTAIGGVSKTVRNLSASDDRRISSLGE